MTYRTDRLCTARHAVREILDDAASRAVWRAVRDAGAVAGASGRCGLAGLGAAFIRPAVLRRRADAFGARGFLDWGGGLVWIAGPADRGGACRGRSGRARAGGTWTLMRAPESLRTAVDVVPPEPEPLARITRRVKAALDPLGILNPGRMYAGL